MSKPVDKKLYDKVKKKVFTENTINSAYRSGLLVKQYKKEFSDKYGIKADSYTEGTKEPTGLTRWFLEKWRNQRGGIGYSKIDDLYRPTVRITKKTPKTFLELTKEEIKKAKVEKKKTGRVKKF
jgi:hypothetical protein